MERKPKNIFIQGAIAASFIGESIAKHSTNTAIGGHAIFLGQVRADIINEKKKRRYCRNKSSRKISGS